MNRFTVLFAAMLCGLLAVSSAYGQQRGGGRGGFMQRSPFDTYVAALADANLSPDFTLTADAKKQIQGVRDDWKKAMDDFRAAHKDELDKAQQAMRDAMGDRDAMTAARDSMNAIMEKGPKADDFIIKIKAALTPDQVTAVDKKAAEMAPQGRPGGGPPAN